MKHRMYSFFRLKKLRFFREGMTETCRNACMLLLSVSLLTCTVTEVAEPLRYEALRMAEKTAYMKKEIDLYRDYLREPGRKENHMQRQVWMQRLQRRLPERPDENILVRQFYRTAERSGISVRQMRRTVTRDIYAGEKSRNGFPAGSPGSNGEVVDGSGRNKPAAAKTSAGIVNRIRRIAWDAELAGSWHALLGFIREIENQDPYTRLESVHLFRGQAPGITVRARLVTYFLSEG